LDRERKAGTTLCCEYGSDGQTVVEKAFAGQGSSTPNTLLNRVVKFAWAVVAAGIEPLQGA